MSASAASSPTVSGSNRTLPIALVCLAVGVAGFLVLIMGDHPQRAWQAYLIHFLLFSGMAQGAMVFSAMMRLTKARWSGPLSSLAEAFAAFFPVSLLLFVVLFLGRQHIFPWLQMDLHGKEVWLNVPFLFGRDLAALILLYGVGLIYLYHALRFKVDRTQDGAWAQWLLQRWGRQAPQKGPDWESRTAIWAGLYCLTFVVVLSLIGYDLVMAADPHWYSTLFGAYTFVKAFYVGLGGLIILAVVLHLSPATPFRVASKNLHDISKLFFAFCLVWADFFYCQFVVIWYGNISEETAYIIERTMRAPWQSLAWTVFAICFLAPFLILLNRKIKTNPLAMAVICGAVIMGIWLEHTLILGPAFEHNASHLPLSIWDGLVGLGFLGLMIVSIQVYLRHFPHLLEPPTPAASAQEVA